jgi:hypothetical protein
MAMMVRYAVSPYHGTWVRFVVPEGAEGDVGRRLRKAYARGRNPLCGALPGMRCPCNREYHVQKRAGRHTIQITGSPEQF